LTWLPGTGNPDSTRYVLEYRQINAIKATPGTTKKFTLRNRSTIRLDGLAPGFTYLIKITSSHPLYKRSQPVGIITTLPGQNYRTKAVHVKRSQVTDPSNFGNPGPVQNN